MKSRDRLKPKTGFKHEPAQFVASKVRSNHRLDAPHLASGQLSDGLDAAQGTPR
jgi:hypothetical protein